MISLANASAVPLRLVPFLILSVIRVVGKFDSPRSKSPRNEVRHRLCSMVLVLLLTAASGAAYAQKVRIMPGSDVSAVAVSSDGRILAEGLSNGDIRLWRLPEYELIRELPGHYTRVQHLAFARSSRFLIAGHQDALEIWEIASGTRLFHDEESAERGPFVVDEKQGSILLGSGRIVQLPESGVKVEILRRFAEAPGYGAAAMAMALDSDADLLYVGTSLGDVRMLRYQTAGAEQPTIVRAMRIGDGRSWITKLGLAGGGKFLIVSSVGRSQNDHAIEVFDAKRLEKLQTLAAGTRDQATDFAIHDGDILVSRKVKAFGDVAVARIVEKWDVTTWKNVARIANHGDFGRLAVGGEFIVGYGEMGMRIMDARGNVIALQVLFGLEVSAIVVSPQRNRLMLAGLGNYIFGFDIPSFRHVATLKTPRPQGFPPDAYLWYRKGVFSPDSRIVYLAGNDSLLAYTLARAGEDSHWRTELERNEKHRAFRDWLWIDSARQKAYGWLDHRVFELDARSGRLIGVHKNWPCANGDLWIEDPFGTDLAREGVCDLYATTEKLMNSHAFLAQHEAQSNPWIWAVSDDRRLLASKRSQGGPIRIWDALTGRQLKAFAEGETRLRGVPVIVGQYVVTRGAEKTLQIWDWQSGAIVRTLQTGSQIAAYTGFDDLLVAASHDAQLHVWRVSSGEKLHAISPELSKFELPRWIRSQETP